MKFNNWCNSDPSWLFHKTNSCIEIKSSLSLRQTHITWSCSTSMKHNKDPSNCPLVKLDESIWASWQWFPWVGGSPLPSPVVLVSLTRPHKWSYFHHHWMRSQNWQLQFCLSVFCFTLLSWILTSQLLKMPNHFNATVFSETSPLLLYICWIQLRFYEISVWVIAVELERTPLWTDNNSLIFQLSVRNCFIRGSVVRYVQLPADEVDTTLLQDATRKEATQGKQQQPS